MRAPALFLIVQELPEEDLNVRKDKTTLVRILLAPFIFLGLRILGPCGSGTREEPQEAYGEEDPEPSH